MTATRTRKDLGTGCLPPPPRQVKRRERWTRRCGRRPLTREALTSADHLPGSDLDLYVFDSDGRPFGPFPGTGPDEQNDLPPSDHDVHLVRYTLPPGAAGQP